MFVSIFNKLSAAIATEWLEIRNKVALHDDMLVRTSQIRLHWC